VDSIPQVDESYKKDVAQKYQSAISFFERTASVMLDSKREVNKNRFIYDLEIDKIDEKLNEEDFWKKTETLFTKIMDFFELDSVVVYSSHHYSYNELDQEIVLHKNRSFLRSLPKSIGFESPQMINEIINAQGVLLPNEYLYDWIKPKRYFGTEKAILFCKQTAIGRILLFAVGYDHKADMSSEKFEFLREVIVSRFFDFVDKSLFAIEMDYVVQETGHMLGRGWGTAMGGFKIIDEIVKESVIKLEDDQKERWDANLWTIKDGLTRIEIIKQNFYLFNSHLLSKNDGKSPSKHDNYYVNQSDDTGQKNEEYFDLISVVDSLREFFFLSRSEEHTSERV
jgi:hypothetical protein